MRTIFFALIGMLMLPVFAVAEVDPALVQQHRTQLINQLNDLDQQIAATDDLILQKRKERESLQRDIAILDANIKLKQLNIKAQAISIARLSDQIKQKASNILELEATIARNKVTLSESIKQLNERDHRSPVELILEYDNLSRFFDELESSHRLQDAIQESVKNLSDLKSQEEIARAALESDKQDEVQFKTLQELEKKALDSQEREKSSILKVTKGKESEYKKILANKQKEAASIRSQLFLLQGSPAIPFEKALEYVNIASRATGVRAAFILAVISQESALGQNIGQCNLPNDPPKYKWRAVMKPDRDQGPYLAITAELGLDPDKMPVSCPQKVGWGGAMGPAQFIPSTWLGMRSAISNITRNIPPNPWDPKDAIVGAGLYLRDIGAAGSRINESTAAAKYFAGSKWKTLGRSYASQVLARADTYQGQIDLLQSVAAR